MSSAAAAVVVHELWRSGTIIGAAATPVLVALFAEALQRPVMRISRLVHPSLPGESVRIYRTRPRWMVAVLTGLAAFVLGAAGLTASEAIMQRAVADRDARTTLFDSALRHSASSARETVPAWRPAAPAAEAARKDKRPPRTPDRRAPDRAQQPSATPTPNPTPQPTPAPSPSATPKPAPQPIPPTETKEVEQ